MIELRELRKRMPSEFRNEIDLKMSRLYHSKYPPKVGNKVVVFTTAYSHKLRSEEREIDDITARGRLIVHQKLCSYAGRSFWKSGQNCYAPCGQTWLIPFELYSFEWDEYECKLYQDAFSNER